MKNKELFLHPLRDLGIMGSYIMDRKKKYKVASLGCRTNQYEASAFAKQLKEMGYVEAKEGESADLCIVNTCTVTESADSSSRRRIRQLAREHSGAKIAVTGCLADRIPEEIGLMEEVDFVVPNKEKEELLRVVLQEEELPEFAIDQFGGHTRSFVKVQDGCNSFCTYCIIPYVRGRSRSRRIDAILREIKALIANGYKEVVITGVNVGDFDGAPEKEEEKVSLAQLVRLVDQLEGLERLRISSIDPDEVDDDLLDAVIGGRTTCHSMHIVLQSGSNAILKKMNRKYTRQMFLEAIEKCKKASADFTFTTDIIVGFPGETEGDFAETLELMKKIGFAKVHMFPYSKRERTKAALYPNSVPDRVVLERKQKLLRLDEQMAFSLREHYIGRTMPVLLESMEGGFFSGHTENFLPVLVPEKGLESNQIVDVLIKENTPMGLKGMVCESK
ncbi:MAG: Threonylcarbamoyladenosine tRNA methylthiotransferase MtaB [Chlamydiae bacterium]|nr:Threonylcarbamoyladenosine tRNA methylthiotransferase MtaB [Chlamydiota bacterium]